MHVAPKGASAWRSNTGHLLAVMACPGRRRARLARLVKSSEFVVALRQRSCARTEHFSMHHVPVPVAAIQVAPESALPARLSTKQGKSLGQPVDESPGSLDPTLSWLGAVVPKRHARRAVTRTLLKRAIYSVAESHSQRLAPGVWVLRLRAPFDRAFFRSAASETLRRTSRGELESLFGSLGAVA